MTRNEFIDNITEWYELKDFATTLTAMSVRTSMTMMITMTASKKISAMLSPTTVGGTSETSLATSPAGDYYYRRNSAFDYDGLDDDDF